MAQFDVYQNPSRNTRGVFPYIVDIQSPIIADISTRIVVPLVRQKYFKGGGMIGLTPEMEYAGETLLLLIPQISSIPSSTLKNPIGSLLHCRDEIIAALDFAVTGI